MKRRSSLILAICLMAAAVLIVWEHFRKPRQFRIGPPHAPGSVKPQLASAVNNAVLVGPDGRLWGWGESQPTAPLKFLTGKAARSEIPMLLSKESDWQRVVFGPGQLVALKTNGSLWIWGFNTSTATGKTNIFAEPMRVGEETDWLDISAGMSHALALKRDGTLWGWGQNNYGQMGDGTRKGPTRMIVRIGSDSDWKAISVGAFNSYALKRDGTIWAWGMNTVFWKAGGVYAVPKQIDPGTNWIAITAGDYDLAALRQDGTLWMYGPSVPMILDPCAASGSPTATMVQAGNDSDWCEIHLGQLFLLARKANGSWWACGRNHCGQLGIGVSRRDWRSMERLPFEFEPWAIACGSESTILLTQDGALWSWGRRIGTPPLNIKFKAARDFIGDFLRTLTGRLIFQPSDYRIDVSPRNIGTVDGG